jgi:uncharacterized protein (TIGR03437 family)
MMGRWWIGSGNALPKTFASCSITISFGQLWAALGSFGQLWAALGERLRISLFCACWLALLTALAAAQTLNNPGFEGNYNTISLSGCTNTTGISGSLAEGWIENSCWNPQASVHYARDTALSHSGAAAQRITVSQGRIQFGQATQFSQARLYTFSLWLRAQAPMHITLLLRKAPAPYTVYALKQFRLSTEWAQYSLTGTTDQTPGTVLILSDAPGTFWVDDASLTSVPWTPELPTGVVPREFFGMHIHRPYLQWPAVSGVIGAVRLWDADGAQWAEVNTSPGVYNWAGLDAHVQRALANNAEVLLCLGRTPRWASARPDEACPYGPGQAAEPANDQYWRDWVTAVATRFKGKIKYWEIWNEPNDQNFYSGTPERMIELARQAYELLKRIDPNNKIVTPSYYKIEAFDQYLALGGGNYADIIGYHFYPPAQDAQAPEVLYQWYIPALWQCLGRNGQQQKPLWNTEAGWLRPLPHGPKTIDDETGAGLVARGYVLNWASRINRFFFYAWDNRAYLNVEPTLPDNHTLSPAGVAYREIAKWLTGARLLSLTESADGVWMARLRQTTATDAWIVWHPTQRRDFDIPASWNVRLRRELNGGYTGLFNATRVPIGPVPIWLGQSDLATSVSGATYRGPELARESIATIFGAKLATATEIARTLPLPTQLAGTQVRIRDSAGVERLASLFFVSPTQINYQLPPDVALGAATVTIFSGDGTVSVATIQVVRIEPGLFTADASGRGLPAALVLRVREGRQHFEALARFDTGQGKLVAAPIDLGPASDQVFVVLFGTGLRQRGLSAGVSASIGGLGAELTYIGAQGSLVGVDQINARLPRALSGRGEVELALLVEGRSANAVRFVVK